MIPLYGFLEGDTLGLLILGYETETVRDLGDKLQQSARMRVARIERVKVLHRGRELDPRSTLAEAGLQPLERFDVVRDER